MGVLLSLDGLGNSTGVRDDYVMAGVYIQIYMTLMGNISLLLTSMYHSPRTGQPRGLAS